MNDKQFIKVLLSLPEVREIELNQSDKEELCQSYLDIVMEKVTTSHEWDFALDVNDMDIVIGQSNYTLVGRDNDCWKIHSLRTGSGTSDVGYNLLEKLEPEQSDKWLDGRSGVGVQYWYPDGFIQKRPVAHIVDTPTDVVDNIRYRYWRTNISFNSFPDGFDLLFLIGVKYLLGTKSEKEFLRAIRSAINDYNRSGGDSDPVGGDPRVIARNNERARLYSRTDNYDVE